MHADSPEEERDKAHLLKAKIEAEYQETHLRHANPTKRSGKKMLHQEFLRGQAKHHAPIEDRAEYRAHILAHSLFPNLFNREMVMKEGGRS